MFRRLILVFLFGVTVATQIGCAPLAAGVAGAAIGNEHAKREDKRDGDRD